MACTVVSLYPKEMKDEFKPGLSSGTFSMPASDGETPVVLHINDEFTRRVYIPLEKDPAKANMNVPESAAIVAASVVNDFINSTYLMNTDCRPGIFWVEGIHEANEIERKFPAQLAEAKQVQSNWLTALLRDGDDAWQKFHLHNRINDLHRLAATMLGKKREWGTFKRDEQVDASMINCKFCTTSILPEAIICPNCKQVLDSERFEEAKAS